MSSKKILFICKKRVDSYGVSFGLLNSATFIANCLKKRGYEVKVVCVVDNNKIDREVHLYKPDYVVIHALWVVPDKVKLLIEKYPKIKWIIRIHSQLPFIANEGIAFPWICKLNDIQKKHDNLFISGNNHRFSNDLDKLNIDNVYLPNIYCPNVDSENKVNKSKYNIINIACFGALRPMKNHLVQAVAAIDFANRNGLHLRFHINGDRIEQKGDQPLKNIRAIFAKSSHELVEHKWMPHKEFLELIKTMDIGMQVSFSESFNIVAADFVLCEVPIVVSEEIEWMPCITKAHTTHTNSISKALGRNYYLNKWFFGIISRFNKWAINRYNRHAERVWLRFLD